MYDELQQLLANAQKTALSAQERESQRRSFACGSGSIERDSGITRETVALAASTETQSKKLD